MRISCNLPTQNSKIAIVDVDTERKTKIVRAAKLGATVGATMVVGATVMADHQHPGELQKAFMEHPAEMIELFTTVLALQMILWGGIGAYMANFKDPFLQKQK